MPEDSENQPVARNAKGYAKLPAAVRQRVADVVGGSAALAALIGLFASARVDGVWLRYPVLLAGLIVLACAWVVHRRMADRVSPVLAGGLAFALFGLGLMAAALHAVSPWVSLAGGLMVVSALAMRGAYERGLVKGRDLRTAERGPVTKLIDNIEGLGAALVLVLIVWHFGLEAFQIPSGSMAPTLIGSSVGNHMLTDGDRVLVDKFVYQYRDPEVWEPIVFRYPLRRTDPYIKRCVGEAGWQVLIARGDVYVKRHENAEIELLRKTPVARDVLWLPMMDEPDSRKAWVKNFQRNGDVEFDEGLITFGDGGAVVFPRGETDDEPGNVTDHDASFGATETPKNRYNHHVVGDVRLRVGLTLQADTIFIATIVRDEDVYRLEISADADVQLMNNDTQIAADQLNRLNFEPDAEYDLEFSLADGELVVVVDDDEVARVDVGTPMLDQLRQRNGAGGLNLAGEGALEIVRAEPPDGRKSRIEMRTEGEGAEVVLHGIDRDIYYRGRVLELTQGEWMEKPFQVELAGDQYLALGDNSPGSADCRLWVRITFFLEDDTQISGGMDPTSNPELAELLVDAGFEDEGVTTMYKLQRLALFSADERDEDPERDGNVVADCLLKLRQAADKKNRATFGFYTEGGGYLRVRLNEITRLQVEPHRHVSRNLFVGRPFSVFLSPRGIKLID